MDASLPAWFPLEMFHYICDVSLASIDAGLFKRLVEQPSCGSDKRLALKIFIIPRLLADKQNLSAAVTFAEHRLGRILP